MYAKSMRVEYSKSESALLYSKSKDNNQMRVKKKKSLALNKMMRILCNNIKCMLNFSVKDNRLK